MRGQVGALIVTDLQPTGGEFAEVDLGRIELHRRQGFEHRKRVGNFELVTGELPGEPVCLDDVDRAAGQLATEDVDDHIPLPIQTAQDRDHRLGEFFVGAPIAEVISQCSTHGDSIGPGDWGLNRHHFRGYRPVNHELETFTLCQRHPRCGHPPGCNEHDQRTSVAR